MANSEAQTLAVIRECRDHILGMCESFDDADWHLPTACPGWDVQDVVAHLGSVENYLLGHPDPALETTVERPWVRNPLGELNERLVEHRRPWPASTVVAELRTASEERLVRLGEADEATLDQAVPSPRGGTMPLRRFLGVRLWDFAVHEADIAEATGRPLRTGSPAAVRMLDEIGFLAGRSLGKAGVPEGTTLHLALDDESRTYTARVTAGRGELAAVPAEEATLHLRASPAIFLRVATGRRDPTEAITAGDVAVLEGDRGHAAAVLAHFNVVP